MNSPRFWILLLAVVSFLGGIAAGILLGDAVRPARETVPFAAYQERLSEEFELGPERRRALRMVMAHYHRALEDAKARRAVAMEDDLVRLGLQYRDLIRDHVLPQARREEFDRLAVPGFPNENYL